MKDSRVIRIASGVPSGRGSVLGIALLCTVFAVSGCRSARYEPDPEFVDLYVDLKLVSTALQHDMAQAGEMRRAVLARHGMTPAEFHEHYMKLAGDPEAWRPFQERVVARLDAHHDAHHESRKDSAHGR